MKRFMIIILFVMVLISACGLSEQDIQATAQTGMTETQEALPTSTYTPIPTSTPKPVEKFMLEYGVCLDFRDFEGNPKDIGCVSSERKSVEFKGNDDSVTLSSDGGNDAFVIYCALYDLKGKLIDSQIAKPGSDEVTCSISGK